MQEESYGMKTEHEIDFPPNLPAAVQCPCTPSYTGQKELGHATSLSSMLPLGEELTVL